MEAQLRENIESFFRQDYRDYEILFAADEANDPALNLVREIGGRYPQIPCRILVTGTPPWPNPPAYCFYRMAEVAAHEILVTSDSDVEVAANYLREVVAPMLDEKVGMTKIGLKAHIGAEISCAEGGRLVLLVSSAEGYKNLCRLLTRMKLRSEKGKGAIRLEEAEEFSSGLICLTGGEEGLFANSLRQGGPKTASALVERLRGIFGRENLYTELQRHFLRDEERRNQVAVELARRFRLPLLATNGVCHERSAILCRKLFCSRLRFRLHQQRHNHRHSQHSANYC